MIVVRYTDEPSGIGLSGGFGLKRCLKRVNVFGSLRPVRNDSIRNMRITKVSVAHVSTSFFTSDAKNKLVKDVVVEFIMNFPSRFPLIT